MSTPQHKTMLRCTSRLLSAFKANLIHISASLLAESLIPPALLSEMNNNSHLLETRACSLVCAVTAKVEESSTNYEKLIEVLSKDGEFHKDLLAELQETLESFQSSTGEQHVNSYS